MLITEKMKESLDVMRKKFVYEADGKLDSWQILDTNKDVINGDCDDFSITIAYLLSDKNMLKLFFNVLTLKIIFWFVLTEDGYGHIVMKHNGYYVDNRYKTWMENFSTYRKIMPVVLPFVLMKLLIGLFVK